MQKRTMQKRTTVWWAVAILVGVVIPGLIILMATLAELARWGGFVEALPWLALAVLFLVGHWMSATNAPRKPRR